MKKSSIFCTSAFLAFIMLASVVTLVRPKEMYSYYENRNLAVFPEYTSESVADGSFFSNIEKYCIDHAAGRNTILKIKTAVDEYILHRPVVNEVIANKDLILPRRDYQYDSFEETEVRAEWYARQLGELTDIIESYGGYYCYVGVPCQFNYYSDKYPSYLENMEKYSSNVLTLFSQYANEYEVNFLDMGDITSALGHPDWFSSTTDNHYSLMGAYLTYTSVIDRINADTGLSLSYPLEENGEITFTQLENRYIGAWERKLFGLSSVHDAIYTSSFRYNIPFTRTDSGAISESKVYFLPMDDSTPVFYSMYMGGDRAETVIDTNRPELPDILIYGDSFTNAVECLAYYSFDTMTSIDLRHYDVMTLAEYIEIHKPDIVICIRDYEDLITPYQNGDVFGRLAEK